jgi:hypothetical protein
MPLLCLHPHLIPRSETRPAIIIPCSRPTIMHDYNVAFESGQSRLRAFNISSIYGVTR